MAEKGFKQESTANNSIMQTISTGHTQNVSNTPNTQKTPPADGKKRIGRPPTRPAGEYCRFSLSMPVEYRDYLKQAVYDASSPGNIVTMTEYLCNLIKADMEAHNGKK